MKAFYTLLGCIVWNRVMETVKRIQSLSDEEFNRMVQSVGPEEKKMAITIRRIGGQDNG